MALETLFTQDGRAVHHATNWYAGLPSEFERDPRYASLSPFGHDADDQTYDCLDDRNRAFLHGIDRAFMAMFEDEATSTISPEDYEAIRDEADFAPEPDDDYLPEPPEWLAAIEEGGAL